MIKKITIISILFILIYGLYYFSDLLHYKTFLEINKNKLLPPKASIQDSSYQIYDKIPLNHFLRKITEESYIVKNLKLPKTFQIS